MASRNGTLDILKVAMALMVVGIHVNPLKPLGRAAVIATGDGLFRIAVPAFLVLNGYFFLSAAQQGRAGAYVRRVLVLYGLWMLVYTPIWLPEFAQQTPGETLTEVAIGYWHFWYLTSLALAAALAAPMRDWPAGRILAVAGGCFAIGVVLTYGQALGCWRVENWVHRNGLFLGLPFLLAGMLIRRQDILAWAPRRVWLGLAGLGVVLVVGESLALYAFAPRGVAHDNMASLAFAAPALVLAALALPVRDAGRDLGLYANGIFYTHVAFLVPMLHVAFLNATAARPLTWALTVAGAVAASWVLIRTGLSRRLL